MSAPTTEPFVFENYPPEPDPSAPNDVALVQPPAAHSGLPWWGYPAVLLGAVIFAVAWIIAWATSTPAIIQQDTYVWPQHANKVGCYGDEVRDAANTCVDRNAYKRADAPVQADLERGEEVFTSWVSKAGFTPNSTKALTKYLCTASYDQYGAFYAANTLDTTEISEIVVTIWQMDSQGGNQPQVPLATVHLPYVSASTVAKKTCTVTPSWVK